MNYTSNQTAQGLASLGRGNDSMLVHMTPREVEGLQGLAMAHGGSLTVNPETGLPEAGFLDAVLPMAAGFALGPGGFGLFQGPNAALMAGLTVGGLTALASGDIGKGLMAGFGAYGGSGLGEAVKGFGSQAAKAGAAPTGEVMKQAIGANQMNVLNPTGAPGVNVFSGAGAPGVKLAGATQPYSGLTGPTGQIGANLSAVTPRAAMDTYGLNIPGPDVLSGTDFGKLDYSLGTAGKAAPQTLGQGFSNVMADPTGFAKEYGPGKLALQGGSLALETLQPEVPQEAFYTDPEAGKYRSASGGLSLSDKFDTRLRLAQGGAINTGGIRDLYGTQDDQLNGNLSRDGYGLGRLNNLANQQSLADAQITGYADGGLTALKSGGQPGGYLNGDGDGMSDSIPATIDNKQPARLADGEFVIPADVVSHLGNGSSKAGSKRLYAMLDKVRQARTGTKKQGKEIKAEKYMPA